MYTIKLKENMFNKITVLSGLILTMLLLVMGSTEINAQGLPKITKVIRLGEGVNSKSDEVKPILNKDGSIMYFTRAGHKENAGFDKRPHNQDIWESVKTSDGTWKSAEKEVTLNNEWDNSIIGSGIDGNFFLLNTYQPTKDLEYGIASTKKVSEHSWTMPNVISVPKLKYDGNFYDFYITHDEKVMIISITGEDTKGEEDLYVSFNKGDKWSEPKSLGAKINTAGYEMSPFLSVDQKYLYFSTNGRKDGYGDADIYYSERLDDSWTNWSEPVNMGDIVNSDAMDCYFSASDNGKFYFSSTREGKDLDIFEASTEEIPPVISKEFVVKGMVRDTADGSPMALEMSISDEEGNEITKVKSNHKGRYEVELEKGKVYVMNILKSKYHEHHDRIETPALDATDSELEINVWMKPYKAGDKIKLENLYFLVSTDTLREVSLPVVEKLATILLENPDINISIEGHTSSEGTNQFNNDLSEARAKRIKTILADHGIKKNRLKTVGWGERHPIVKNITEEDRQLNRRVEFIILE